MGKGSPAAPAAPDPYATSRAQSAANKETALYQAQLNMMNQTTPGGSVKYTQNGTWADGTPKFEVNQELSPQMKAFYDQAQSIAGNQMNALQGTLSKPFDTSKFGQQVNSVDTTGLPALQGGAQYWDLQTKLGDAGPIQRGIADAGPIQRNIEGAGPIQRNIANAGQIRDTLDFSRYGDPNVSRDSVQNALFSRLQPQLQKDRDALETRLANQGITIGSQAYNDAIDEANRQSTDARYAAIINAGQEQNRLQQLALNEGGFANSAQSQRYGQNANDATFANAAQNQLFGQNSAQLQANNAAQAQQYGQNANNAEFANAAQAQQFGQNLDAGNFWNTAQQTAFNQRLSNANLANQARAQGFNENMQNANFQNTARQNSINEALMQRSLPLNEMSALINGGGVQTPGYINTPQTGVQGTDVAGPQALAYQAQQNAYNQQMGQRNAAMGGLFGLGAGLGGGYLAGGGKFWGK